MRALPILALMSLAAPAAGLAQALPGAPRPDDAGYTFVKPPPKRAAAAGATPVAELPGRPRLSPLPDPAPRIGGYVEPGAGGGACRTSCAGDYYVCLRVGDMSSCGATWAQCQAACPDASSSE